ncbi:MAG: protoporphyrinogen/coproporphyrinogen oxidase [Thermoanaerobaculia bacterium]
MSSSIAILGAGMAGLGAAWRLAEAGAEGTVFEKLGRPGGHTRSFRTEGGFIFDDGPHISFTKNPRIQELFAESVRGEFEVVQARVNNHWRGHWIKHPAQCNLYGLPPDVVSQVIHDFVEARAQVRGDEVPANYEDWLLAAYGRMFAETFPMVYGEKYHTLPARLMSTDWLGPRLYRPDLKEILDGALAEETEDFHYAGYVRYPTKGGFESYLRLFLEKATVESSKEAIEIDPAKGLVRFSDGTEITPDGLVSSLPLPALVGCIRDAPSHVVDAASTLACSKCVTVNVGVNREDLSDHHWTYVYDRDFTATRLSFPHMFSPGTVPAGTGSIQAEVYFSDKYRPLDVEPDALIEPVLGDLRRCGLLRQDDGILHAGARLVEHGNVIFDLDRNDALAVILPFLDEVGIATCGRYGLWGYHWTDESFESGEAAVQKVLDGLRLGRR